jgi:TonB-dependent receptor
MTGKMKLLRTPIIAASLLGMSDSVLAQMKSIADEPVLEEVVVFAKLKSAADDVIVERLETDVVADIIDAETIGRIGDSNVASALRRVPGVTLVDDKYVFIRGLGERYSNSLLNGAVIPSPDLTRNVIPLDIFPTSILKSIAVKKSYSAEMPAAFSGGLIDIRTRSIPDQLLFSVEIGTKQNIDTHGDVLSYTGGSDDSFGTDDGSRALSSALMAGVDQYRGSLGSIDILNNIQLGDGTQTLADAQAINRDLALLLNRDIDITEQSAGTNGSLEANVGNNFYLENGMELGFMLGAAYGSEWSNKESMDRSFGDPDDIFAKKIESIRNVNMTGNASFGWRWYDDHRIETTSIFLRNTDYKASITDSFTSSFPLSDGKGFREYGTRFEERNLSVNQIRGEHRFGGITRDLLNFDRFEWLDELTFKWFYSNSISRTDIPNQTTVLYKTSVDSATAEVIGQNLQPSASAGDFRFTDLDDDVESYGYDISLPLMFSSADVTLSGGYRYSSKTRTYEQLEFGLGTDDTAVAQSSTGTLSEIFSDENILNADNGFSIAVIGSNGESYLAALTNTSLYGTLDILWDETWRLTLGARWEDYNQVGIPWNPLKYQGCAISCDESDLLDSVFKEDDFYPSISATYIKPDFWAEDFQLRFAYSETLVRPDLREITPSSYLDPITGGRVSGNANVIPAMVENYDLRAEWFFSNGDNFTASLFYKDIQNPIEFFEAAAFEEALATEIINAESSTVYGLELEWLKGLGFLGTDMESFFVAGNMTMLDSELTAGEFADAPTNATRPMSGASDYAVNFQLGYDSADGKHGAMLIYNVFGERLYFAGRNGSPDAYEQPFNALDATYFYYPTDQLTIKLKLKNLLDEKIEITQDSVVTHEERPGTTVAFDIKWSL